MNPINDTSPMPFGKFKGQPMSDVPVKYLHYLWSKADFKKIVGTGDRAKSEHQLNSVQVAEYINTNLNALKMEDEDLIW